jgi:hypothetical protein
VGKSNVELQTLYIGAIASCSFRVFPERCRDFIRQRLGVNRLELLENSASGVVNEMQLDAPWERSGERSDPTQLAVLIIELTGAQEENLRPCYLNRLINVDCVG